MPNHCEICCEILIAILLPPLGVCFRHGCCSVEFCICLLLTILGYASTLCPGIPLNVLDGGGLIVSDYPRSFLVEVNPTLDFCVAVLRQPHMSGDGIFEL
ncbi:hypothetical protein OIU76_009369 [Salix suchowensis]|nr:hypothetical protein OIU76_009369 [Salix suchowensis]